MPPPPQCLRDWARNLADAVVGKQGGAVAALLSTPPSTGDLGGWQPRNAQELLDLLGGHALSEVAYYEAMAVWAPTPARAIRFLLCAVDSFLEFHTAPRRTSPVGWDTAILVTMVHRVRECALLPGAIDASGDGDDAAPGDGDVDVVGVLVRTWRKAFLTIRDLDPHDQPTVSRSRGALALLNGLLAILFVHRNTHQARIIIQSVAQMEQEPGAGVLQKCGHMGSEVVRFLFYRGRLALYDRDAATAFAAFRDAVSRLPPFDQCTANVRRNRQRLVFFWSIAGIACGAMPPEELYAPDPLLAAIVGALTSAIGSGSDTAFDTALEYYAPLLKLRGVYALLLAAARPLCLLVRLMRVHAAIGALPGGDASRVPLELLLRAEQEVTDAPSAASPATVASGGGKRSKASKKKNSGNSNDAAAAGEGNGDATTSIETLHKRGRNNHASSAPFVACDAEAAVLEGASYVPRHRAERQELRAAVRRVLEPVDELGLRVAQLIGSGRVMGYVATDARTLVLSKKNPFPRPAVSSLGYTLPGAST